MRVVLALSIVFALCGQPAFAQSKTQPTVHAPNEAPNATLARALAALDAMPPSSAALQRAQATFTEAHRDLAAYLQGRPRRRGAPSPIELRALLDPLTGAFVVTRGTLWLRPEHHERLARAAHAVGEPRLARAHQNAAEAARP